MHQDSGECVKHTWRNREKRLPTDMKSDGQALPWQLQSGSRKKVSRVSREEVLLCPSQHIRLQLDMETYPKNDQA